MFAFRANITTLRASFRIFRSLPCRGVAQLLQLTALAKKRPPNVEHWHGAAPDSWFTHVSVETNIPNNTTTWLETVDDNAYLAKEKGIIYGTGAWNIGDIKKLPVMQQAYDMGFKA